MRKYLVLTILAIMPYVADAQATASNRAISKEQVIAQMNYCINSITNITNHNSISLLEHETDQLVNNLTMEQVVGLYEVQSFRGTLIEKIGKLQINEEEKELMKRIQEMERKNLLYQSISNSLNPTLLLTGGGNNRKQLAFMAFITMARTTVEYKSASNEADIKELEAMWKYRKNEITEFTDLRKEALELVYKLFQKYNLNESDRLTEATATLFSQIIAETDPHARIRKLLDNRSTFQSMADYYYHLGMAYIDADNYSEGENYLDKYISLYSKAPIFRHDEKTGCVALTKLAIDKDLTSKDIINLTTSAIENLPNNGPAIIQSVLVLYDADEKEMAFNLLRSGIDNDLVSDKDALVMLATKLIPDIRKFPSSMEQITAAIKHCEGLSINSYLPFIINSGQTDYLEKLTDVVSINNDGEIVVGKNYKADISSIIIQKERHKDNSVVIQPCGISYSNAIPEKEINRKLKFLKSADPDLIHIFFENVSGDNMYRVKSNLDYQRILKGDYKGMNNMTGCSWKIQRQRKKLVKYLRGKINESDGCLRISFKEDKKKGKKSLDIPYADCLVSTETTSFIDYTNYNSEDTSSGNGLCRIKTRKNVFKVFPPLKNYPKEIIRVILQGVDTTQLCFTCDKEYSLYSFSINNQEYFTTPYKAFTKRPESIHPQKEGWFKRLFHKRAKVKEQANKTLTTDNPDDNKGKKQFSETFIGGVLSIFFKIDTIAVSTTNDAEKVADERQPQTKNNDSNNKNWAQRIWKSVQFWKK